MNYKITITGSAYPHNETETVTVTGEQLISALINEFDYEIDVDGTCTIRRPHPSVSSDSLDIHSADAYIDDLEASMSDAVINGLYSLLRDEREKQS